MYEALEFPQKAKLDRGESEAVKRESALKMWYYGGEKNNQNHKQKERFP
jgi:hypothetical protein